MNPFSRLREDITEAKRRDPAARHGLEVFLVSSGLHAVWGYRFAHMLWGWRLRLIARIVSQLVRFLTGVEIHPGATIGRRLFIDHGMGVVIGATAIIGDDVLLFHGVTLGGRGIEKDCRRHPTVGNRVEIGANATVLGPVHLHDDARIGANAVVLADVPAGKTAVGVPARIV